MGHVEINELDFVLSTPWGGQRLQHSRRLDHLEVPQRNPEFYDRQLLHLP